MTPQLRRENYRQTSKEARVAMLAWIVTLAWVVGVSWWVGSERPTELWLGIPAWVLLGPGIGWICTFAFNSWFAARMLSNDGSASSSEAPHHLPSGKVPR